MNTLEKVKAFEETFRKRKEALVIEMKKELPKLLAPVFEKHENVKSVGWRQYTPYWNDGSPCEFSVHTYDLYINGVDDTGWNEEVEHSEEEYNKEAASDFDEILCKIPDEFFEGMFGDHVKVTVHRDGEIDIDEYEHD